jgi:hypothetical protein
MGQLQALQRRRVSRSWRTRRIRNASYSAAWERARLIAWRSASVFSRRYWLLGVLALAGCDTPYTPAIAERIRSHGDGPATISEIFGPAARTCIAIGDRNEAFADLDDQTWRALQVSGRDYNTVVIAQFDEKDRLILKRRFHIRNAYVYVDIENNTFGGSAGRCLPPTSVVEVGADESGTGVRIP